MFWVYKVEKAATGSFFFFWVIPNFKGQSEACVIYSARLDINAKVTTAVVFVILAAVSTLFIFLSTENARWGVKVTMYIAALIPVSIFLFAYLCGPVAYELTDDALVVHRRSSTVTIFFRDILHVDLVNESFVQDLERTGGNGGVFGYYGEFSAGRDAYQLYATSMRNTVLIATRDGRKLIISPSDRSIVSRLRERI